MEKRKHLRTNIEVLEVVIEEIHCSKGKYENVTLFIEEVSHEGIRFSTNIEFSPGEIITFHLPSLNLATFITGRIAWKAEAEKDRFQYGLQIVE